MRIITNPLGGSALTEAFLAKTASAEWYPSLKAGTAPGEFLLASARQVAEEFKKTNWLPVLSDAFGFTGASLARERLERASKGGIVVTTGQQPGLFGGPMYALSKALSALALANELEKRTGLVVAPVFWAATDDADFAEASSIVVPASEGALELRVEKSDDVPRPLASEPFPETAHVLGEFLRGVGSSSNSGIVDLVRVAYERRESVGGAYIELLRGILEPLGISVLDAAHQAVREAGHSLLRTALSKADAIAAALSGRNDAIKGAGFKVQVREVTGRSVVFRYTDHGKERVTVSHAAAMARDAKPGDLSATVLVRPIIECAILPTAAYVAGPAEIAYFAQVSAVADALGARQPVVVPRWSGTVVEPRVERILERYKLDIVEFSDPHALETRHARALIPNDVQAVVTKLRDGVNALTSSAKKLVDSPVVSDAVVTGLQRDLARRVERFERRVAAAVKRDGTQELRDIQAARASLYPLGKPQERAVSFVAMLARYGSELQTKMLEAAGKHAESLL